MDRPKWNKLMQLAKNGFVSIIYMDEISRMGRDRHDGFKQWMQLYEWGVELKFLKTEHANTSVYRDCINRTIKATVNTKDKAANELINSIIKCLNNYMAELAKRQIEISFDEAASEREFLSKRTKEGMAVAALNGKQIGRVTGTKVETKKKRHAKEIIKKYYVGYGGVLNATQCIKVSGISKQTFYTYLKEINCELEN